MPHTWRLPHFPAPNLKGVIGAVQSVLDDLVNAGTGKITNITQSITDVWELDCGGKWVVYVTTATVAVNKSIWLLLTPSLDEVFEEYLEPKNGRRGHRRKRRGTRIRRAINANAYRLVMRPPIQDVDSAIAGLLPGRAFLKGRRQAPGEWVFWTSVSVADSILWHWLLLEATETFTTTWQSEIIESGECGALSDGHAKFTTAKQTPFFSQDLWGSKDDLIGLSEDGLFVSNNGQVALPVSTLQGHALILVLGHWEVTMKDKDTTGTWRLGINGTVFNKFGDVIADKTLFTTMTAGRNQVKAAILDFAIITEDFHRVSLQFRTETEEGGQWEKFEAWADVSIGIRGVGVD